MAASSPGARGPFPLPAPRDCHRKGPVLIAARGHAVPMHNPGVGEGVHMGRRCQWVQKAALDGITHQLESQGEASSG